MGGDGCKHKKFRAAEEPEDVGGDGGVPGLDLWGGAGFTFHGVNGVCEVGSCRGGICVRSWLGVSRPVAVFDHWLYSIAILGWLNKEVVTRIGPQSR